MAEPIRSRALAPIGTIQPTPVQAFAPPEAHEGNPFALALQGFLAADERQHRRNMQNQTLALQAQDQAFRHETNQRNFEENVRQFGDQMAFRREAHEASTRLYDERMALDRRRLNFQEEQASLSMKQQRLLMDDAQRAQQDAIQFRAGLRQSIGSIQATPTHNVFGDFSESTAESVAAGLSEELAPHAQDFVDAGKAHGIDPRFLASIAMFETGGGTSSAFRNKKNAMGVSNASGPIAFGNVRDSILQQAKTLANPRGPYAGARTIDQIGAIYAPPGAANDPNSTNHLWADSVSQFYSRYQAPELSYTQARTSLDDIDKHRQWYPNMPAAEAMELNKKEEQIRLHNPKAYDERIATRQFAQINAVAVGKNRIDALEESFGDELEELMNGKPMDPSVVQIIRDSLNAIDPTVIPEATKKFVVRTTDERQAARALVQAHSDIEVVAQAHDNVTQTGPEGPIVGRLRGVIGEAFSDPALARLETATTQALPNIARGVFGERGVLTDTDIRRYQRTLPTVADNPNTAKERLNSLRANLKRAAIGQVNNTRANGQNWVPVAELFVKAGIINPQEAGLLLSPVEADPVLTDAASAPVGTTRTVVDPTTGKQRHFRKGSNGKWSWLDTGEEISDMPKPKVSK